MKYPFFSLHTLQRLGFSLGAALTAFLIFHQSIPVAQAAPQLPVCMSVNGTVQTPNNSILKFVQQWIATVPTSNANCVLNNPASFPRTNGINAGAVNQAVTPTASNFLCGYGQSWLYSNPVGQDPYNFSSYNLGNQLSCANGLQLGRTDTVTVEDMNGTPLAPGQHITVGQEIMVRFDPYIGGGYETATQWGSYVNLAQNAYQNQWPYNPNASDPKYVHCPGPGAAPTCSGVDIYSPYGQFGATYGPIGGLTDSHGASLNPPVAPFYGRVDETIVPGSGWTPAGQQDLFHYDGNQISGQDPWGYFFIASQPGNLSLTISTAGSEAAGAYGGGGSTGYVAPANGYSGAWGSLTTIDYNTYFSTQGVQFNSMPVASVVIPVDNPPDNPPATPILSCTPSAVQNGQNTTVSMRATDPDSGDQVRFDVDPNYDGSTFNPSVSVPLTGYVASGSQQSIPLQWATGGVKTVAVRAQDNHFRNSGLATCTVTVTFVPPGPTPNMQFATDPSGATYTDNVVHYTMTQDEWAPGNAGVTIPVQYVGNTYYQSCVVRAYPLVSRGSTPYSTTSTWDNWPTLSSGNTYIPVPVDKELEVHGQGATPPPIGTQLDEEFAFGCGTNAQTSQGQYSGTPDIQEVIITIAASQPPAAHVALKVTDTGNTNGQGYVSASQNNPYVFSEQLASSGAYTTNAQLQLNWQTSNVTNCTFSRTDNGSPQGTYNSTQNWTNGSTGSLLNGSDQGSMSFAAYQQNPGQVIGFTISCTGAFGAATSTAYVSFSRSTLNPAPTVYRGAVFQDTGGVLGVQDAGEPGISGQTMTLVISGYTGGPATYTTVSDVNGNYSFSITPTAAMLQTAVVSITQTTALPNGWVFTTPITGTYANYAMQNGATTVFNFGERSSAVAYSTFTGQVYNDLNGNGVTDAGEKGLANQTLQLTRVTTYVSGAPTTDTLGSALTDASGNYSISSYVPNPPNGATSVTYVVTQTTLPSAGWQYSLPLNGIANFSAVPNTVYHQNFGDIQPLTIQGEVYIDATGSGSAAGQSRIPGIKIQVYDVTAGSVASIYDLSTGSAAPVTSVTTAADGTYSLALGASTNGHLIQVQQVTRNPSYAFCTNPPQGSDGYCEYPSESAGPFTSITNPLIVERDFGNSASAATSVTVVTGRAYQNNDGVPGFNPAYDTPLSSVQVKVSDTSGNVLATVTTDATGLYYYTVQKYSAAYNAVIGKAIVVSHTPPSGYTPYSPQGGSYPSVQYNGNTLVNYDFVDTAGSGGGNPNNPTPSYFCALD